MAYYFNLPRQTELTSSQQLAVDESDSIALKGGPGTGKSVVALWRHIRNYNLGLRNSLLLTYTKTLEDFLRNTAISQNPNASRNIARTYCWTYDCDDNKVPVKHFDEIIIDEAQDVEIGRYNKIKSLADNVSYGADEAQSLYEGSCSVRDLENLFPECEEYELDKNFRNSREILNFTKSVFPHFYISHQTMSTSKVTTLLPVVDVLGWSGYESKLADKIEEIVEEYSGGAHNIAILVASRKQVNDTYELIRNRISGVTKYHSEMDDFDELGSVHITTFKSSKGLEFDTVIIPSFDSYVYFMKNPQFKISDKDYYVGLTRAKTNLYLLCKNNINTNNSSTYIKA